MGHAVTTSLAGRTADPLLPLGEIRIGGFGGAEGLAAYLHSHQVERLIDATHPYAGQISRNAVAAAQAAGVPLLRYMRPQWEQPTGAEWITVEGWSKAAASLPCGSSVLLTTGHGGLEAFLAREDCRFVVRVIEAPQFSLPSHAKLLQARAPFWLQDELQLMERERITHLVAKNSGGRQTAAKLEAAQQLGVEVIMIARPFYEPAREVSNINAAIAALALG